MPTLDPSAIFRGLRSLSSGRSFKEFDEFEERQSQSGFEGVNPMASAHPGYHAGGHKFTASSRPAAPSQTSADGYPPLPNQANTQVVELEMQNLQRTCSLGADLRDTESSVPQVINVGGSSSRDLASSVTSDGGFSLSSSSTGHDAMVRSKSFLPTTKSDSACCPPPCCSYYYNHPDTGKKYACRGCVWFWVIYVIFLSE